MLYPCAGSAANRKTVGGAAKKLEALMADSSKVHVLCFAVRHCVVLIWAVLCSAVLCYAVLCAACFNHSMMVLLFVAHLSLHAVAQPDQILQAYA